MALSNSVEESLKEAELSLRNALAFAEHLVNKLKNTHENLTS